jgi:hypothetical protein
MKFLKNTASLLAAVLMTAMFIPAADHAASAETLVLPAPEKSGGMPLMQALSARKSTRSIKDDALTQQHISNLLWAAFGVNRPDGRRTAPTANNTQKLEIYVALANGVWRYDGKKHSLDKMLERDATKDFGAPLTLVYAIPNGKHDKLHIGSVYQNVGLYCASAGLANVVKVQGVNVLQKDLKLPAGYEIPVVQLVGLPE